VHHVGISCADVRFVMVHEHRTVTLRSVRSGPSCQVSHSP
jgi:hypothetical protein